MGIKVTNQSIFEFFSMEQKNIDSSTALRLVKDKELAISAVSTAVPMEMAHK